MVRPISFSQVLDYERLSPQLAELRTSAELAGRDGPTRRVSPMLGFAAQRLLRDIFMLVAREPYANIVPRIDPHRLPDHRRLLGMLDDARLALDAFGWQHRDHHGQTGDGWITLEAEERAWRAP